jgi:deazaflavin-dependent oxidoreductase (nitroreductase family)
MTALLRLGLKIGSNALLTVPGRKSGEPRTATVTILERDGQRWLQSPFGDVNWVRNLRAAGRATLTRGGRTEEIVAIELSPDEAAPVFRWALAAVPGPIRGYYNATPESSLAALEEEARRHPMFWIVAAPPAPAR